MSKKEQTRKRTGPKEVECAYSGCNQTFKPNNRQHKCHHFTCSMAYTKEVKRQRAARNNEVSDDK